MDKRKTIGVLLIMSMLALSINIGYAEETAVTAVANAVTSGQAVEVPTDGGALVIDKAAGTVIGFKGSVKNGHIPAAAEQTPIIAIGREAFKNCLTLESITMPDSITNIGELAFDNCTKLRSFTVPKGVTAIGKGVFNKCTALSSVTLSSHVVSIDEEAFSNCSKSKLTLRVVKGSAAEKFALEKGYKVSYVTDDLWTTTDSTATTLTTLSESTTETTTEKMASRGGKIRRIRGYIPSSEETTEETTDDSYEEDKGEDDNNDILTGDVRITIGSSIITIGDKEFITDAAPYIQPASNSTLVPLRFAAVAISGGDPEKAVDSDMIEWDAVTKTATIHTDNSTVSFTAGSADMLIDSRPVTMDNGVKAEITGGRMFIPFRALGNAMGVNVYWDSENKTALYSSK